MANVQKHFDQFNDTIKLKRFEENKTLREKRDIILKKLKDRLPEVFDRHDESCPSFYYCDQGSYKMGTGVKPLEKKEFDIDQGMYFAINTTDYSDPVVLKQRVHEALVGHTKQVRVRNSCVTVFYQEDGDDVFHVDLAIYADGSQESDDKSRLAKGKENSNNDNRFWEISKPQELADVILNGFSTEDGRKQFRRLVRYLKRWRDERFTEGGNAAPIGLALTILVMRNMTPSTFFDGKPDDLGALQSVVNGTLGQFVPHWDENDSKVVYRLKVESPVEPWSDLLEKMTNRQMSDFKEKLEDLRDSFAEARSEIEPSVACETLHQCFGRDFPIPAPEETARKHAPAIVSSSSSA